MRKKNSSKASPVDGVVQRKRRRNIGSFDEINPIMTPDTRKREARAIPVNKTLTDQTDNEDHVEVISEDDIIENTRSSIDESKIGKQSWRAKRKVKKIARERKWAKRNKFLRYGRKVVRFGGVALALFGLIFALNAWSALSNIIDRGGDGAVALQENIQPTALNGEGDGRINIMLLGIGGDSHIAGNLADSIIVASIDPFANELAMLSIPRDMYVDIPNYYSTKINAAHAIGEDNPDVTGGGIALMQDTLEETLGINIHYYVRVDFTGFKQAIDTVGGVTITLDEAVYDPNFDWEYGPNALNLPAGEVTLDGQKALLLSRARGATGIGLGVSRGDFGRSDRQRDILLALKDKILSAGTYANPVRISELISNAGDHARTNIQISEMLRLNEIMEKIPSENIISYGLDNGPDNYLMSSTIDGASVQVPKSGSYEEIQIFVRELFVDGFIKQEQPLLDVYNGSSIPGFAAETADELATFGYQIGNVDNAPKQTYQTTLIYDLTNGEKPFTKELLSKRFNVEVKPGAKVPQALATTTADFVIILGTDNAQEDTTF